MQAHSKAVKSSRKTAFLNVASFVVANVGANAMARSNAKMSPVGIGVGTATYHISSTSISDMLAKQDLGRAEASHNESVVIRRILECFKMNADKNAIGKCRDEVTEFEQSVFQD